MPKPIYFLSLFFYCQALQAQLKSIETKDMRLISYDADHDFIIPHTARCFYNALRFHEKLFDYTPTQKTTVLLQDFGDYGNGGAAAVPNNYISVALSPFSYTFETSPAGERMFALMNHELVHIVSMDNATKSDRFFQKLFSGKVYPAKEDPISAYYSFLTSPRRYSPRWYHEGIASYVETWMSGGIGLGMGSYDEMIFRTRVHENALIYSAQGLEAEGTTADFQGKTNSYLYGTRFMGYLANQYGPQKLINWVKRNEGSKRSYSAQFKNIYGKHLTQSWDEWIQFEKKWQEKNVSKLAESPVTEVTPISDKIIGSVSYPFFDKKRNAIYMAINYPGVVPHLAGMDLSTGKVTKLKEIKGGALFYVSSLTYDDKADVIYYTSDNDEWRDLNSFDLKSKKSKVIWRDCRIGELTLNKQDRSIWGIKHANGYSLIERISASNHTTENILYDSSEVKLKLDYGQDIFDIDISPDGKILSAAVSDYRGNQSLLFYDIASLDADSLVIDTVFNFEISSPQSFRFTDDGKYLFGCSYYSGVSNIYRVDVTTKEILPMSNAITGLFRPLEIDSTKLLAFNFKSKGFQPVYIQNKPVECVESMDFLGTATVEKFPELKTWQIPISTSQDLDIDSITTFDGKYKKVLKLTSAYPVVVGYKNFMGLGYSFNFDDAVGFRNVNLTGSYTPSTWVNNLASDHDSSNLILNNDERFHFAFTGRFGEYNFSLGYNEADFYDLFGPTKHSRKGTNFRLEHTATLIYDIPRRLDLILGGEGYYGLEKSPEFQQISTKGFSSRFFFNLDGSLSFTHLRNSIGAVDPEKGIKAKLKVSSTYSSSQFYPKIQGSFDIGFQLPINHSSLWFRSAAGHSFSSDLNPFTRFGFAAFGNNYVDFQEARRYRTSFSFPGLSYDSDKSIIAQSFGKITGEWVLPPIRFKKMGGLNLYSNWMQANIFSSGLITNDYKSTRNKFLNIGSQIDMKIVIFSLMESTLSLGYAKAFDLEDNKNYNEWMISLKLLK
ncbi:MAG: hypothetical protein ABI844_18225 [Saprospiraceae bacterium]